MQDMHTDFDKIILILEKKFKTKAIVSHCQNNQGRGTLKCQILSLLCMHRTGANCKPLAIVLKRFPPHHLFNKNLPKTKVKCKAFIGVKMIFLI